MVAGIFDAGKTASAQFNFNCGSTTIFTAVAPNTNLGEVTSEEFSLTANSNTITLAAGGGSSQKSIDYVYFQKTGDVEITEPSYATGKLVLADIEGITAGSIADGVMRLIADPERRAGYVRYLKEHSPESENSAILEKLRGLF